VELGQLAPQLAGAVWRSQLPGTVERELAAVEQADVLVVATPVFRGAYTGLFKHFFDFVHQDALIDKPVLLAATGGSERPKIGCHQASFGFVDEDDRSYWLIQQPVCQKHDFWSQ
jgi:NAD(P)H-dependent FMN reductase